MSRMREDLEIGWKVIRRVSAPHHTLRSLSQVARREHLSDDKVTRPLARLSELVGGPLIEARDNRLVPTALGREFGVAVEQLLALGRGEMVEILTIAAAPGVDPEIVAGAMIAFSREWGKIVGLQLTVLPREGIREAVESDRAAFGIVSVGETDKVDERLDPPLPVTAWIPDDHRLAGVGGPLDADHFSPTDRVCYAPELAGALDELLSRVPVLNRVAVESPATLRALVENGAGVGFEYAHPIRRAGDTFSRVPVVGVPPQTLGLVLPRKSARLTDPARYFLGVLRRGPEIPLPPPAIPDLPPIPEPLSA